MLIEWSETTTRTLLRRNTHCISDWYPHSICIRLCKYVDIVWMSTPYIQGENPIKNCPKSIPLSLTSCEMKCGIDRGEVDQKFDVLLACDTQSLASKLGRRIQIHESTCTHVHESIDMDTRHLYL